MDTISGSVAIVTGAGSGIGRASALQFADEGASVVVADIVEQGGKETVDAIEDAGGEATFVKVDVTDSAEVEAMVDEAVETYGGLDFAHNNAGINGDYHMLADQPRDNWDSVIDINQTGVWLCMKHEIPHLRESANAAIVNTASGAGLMGVPTQSPYAASKHGVIGLTRTVAKEYGEHGIRANAVCPSVVETQMTEGKDELQQYVDEVPLGRAAQPDEIASVVVWLCSDGASYISGQSIPVDGGSTA